MYGKSVHRSRRPYRRRTHRRHKKAVPVPKKRVNFKRQNALAVNRISRDIKYLKGRVHGQFQKNVQVLRGPMIPYTDGPILTDLTDFTVFRDTDPTSGQGPAFFQYNATGTALNNINRWQIQDFNSNPYHKYSNFDRVDTGQYMPLKVQVRLKLTCLPSVTDKRIRIQVFSLRPKSIIETAPSLPEEIKTMPDGLRHLNNLAGWCENKLSSTFFRKYLDKYVYLSSAQNNTSVLTPGVPNPLAAGPAVTGNSRILSFTFRPKKIRTQLKTNPIVGPLGADPPVDESSPFSYLSAPQTAPLWMLISSDCQRGASQVITVDAMRYCCWRDGVGSANVVV